MKKADLIEEILRISMQKFPLEFTSTLIAARKEILTKRPKKEVEKLYKWELENSIRPTFAKKQIHVISKERSNSNDTTLSPTVLDFKLTRKSSRRTTAKVRT